MSWLNFIHTAADISYLAEGAQLECKAAQGRQGRGEIPKDFWPTYSAFANTSGGIILLGVSEDEEGFHVLGIQEQHQVRVELWTQLNNREKVSANLLTEQDIQPLTLGGHTIIAVRVPQATRQQRPVYIGQNPLRGAYVRRLESDREHAAIMATARRAFAEGDLEQAQQLLRPVVQHAPGHGPAQQLQREITDGLAKRQAPEPVLRGPDAKPINLDFRDANVRQVFEALSRSTGTNFILDRDLGPDLKTTVFLRNAYVDEAIKLILRTSQLRSKLLGNNTVLIYPDTPEKLKAYQDLMVRAFYLQDAKAEQMQTTLKTLLKTRDMVVDEKLNLLVMRDTPEAIRLAEKLVALHDLAEPEVMLEMEVLEVQDRKSVV